jgi:hypothetical protein
LSSSSNSSSSNSSSSSSVSSSSSSSSMLLTVLDYFTADSQASHFEGEVETYGGFYHQGRLL